MARHETRLERMRESDLDRVLAIEVAVFPTPWRRQHFRSELRNEIAHNLVARIGTRLVGYACCWIAGGELLVNNIAVDPAWRRRGIGRRLLRGMLRLAREAGCDEATLEVRPSNREAIRLYERHGFRVVGRRPRYYADSGEDALLMNLSLGSCPERSSE